MLFKYVTNISICICRYLLTGIRICGSSCTGIRICIHIRGASLAGIRIRISIHGYVNFDIRSISNTVDSFSTDHSSKRCMLEKNTLCPSYIITLDNSWNYLIDIVTKNFLKRLLKIFFNLYRTEAPKHFNVIEVKNVQINY